MKAIIVSILVLVTFSEASAQSDKKRKKVKWEDWSDSLAFISGPEPLVLGEGIYSDSLSTVYDGKTFFEVEGEYFAINSVADYYLWFVSKYPYLFRSPISSYRFFYRDRDNYNMARYVTENYSGRKIPLKFVRVNERYNELRELNRTLADERRNPGDTDANLTRIEDEISNAYRPAPSSSTPKVTTPKKKN